jgi:hypothetical protein
MCRAKCYRALPYFYATICILEVIVGILLLLVLSGNWILSYDNNTNTTSSALPISSKAITSLSEDVLLKCLAALVFAFASEIVPIFTGIVLLLSLFSCCICLRRPKWRRPFLRFIALNCNCPCCKPRPKLRFILQIAFRAVGILFRVLAVIMYGVLLGQTSSSLDQRILKSLLIVTAGSLILPLLTILLDLYHYRVWWAYEPDVDIPPDIAKKPLSRKHKRFIPYPLIGDFRTNEMGNGQCKAGSSCHRSKLEHVVIFHSSKHEPQPRWSPKYPVYIGFHRTTPQAAISIAKTEFRGSLTGMLGPGAYFARSTEATLMKIGKPDQTGAWFVAEIFMGKVFSVEETSIRSYPSNTLFDPNLKRSISNGDWQQEYDTCYFKHSTESKDEFCIKDPEKQIIRWVVVIEAPHDKKIASYGLDVELEAGPCGCF